MRILLAQMAMVVASIAYGQLEIKSGTALLLPAGTEVREVGGRVMLRSDQSLQGDFGQVVIAESDAAKIDFEVENEQREPVAFEKLTKTEIFLGAPGKYFVEVTAIDFAKSIYGRKKVVVEVGGDTPGPGPGPDPGPGPTPPTPGPDSSEFDGLAGRVAVYAAKLGMDQRSQIAGVLGNAADKMRSFEFKLPEQAKEYIARNWPPCTSPDCKAIWDLVAVDAAKRMLSWEETQEYYHTVAKGVLQ